ncbi:MAG: hypothetical protein Q8K72_00875, partial [Acidimicrobiales bacterium]|nr:hypothetical protein [Acidimicrobiales bacterium]
LAELLERWDAGLTANPTERRMALRLSQQRAARVGAAASEETDAVKGLATVRALFGDDPPPSAPGPLAGDDDDPAEIDADVDPEHYYDDAFPVIR